MAVIHVAVTVMRLAGVAVRVAVVVMVVESAAVVPVYIPGYTAMVEPPGGVVTPVPGTCPCVPCGTPEPIVYHRTIDIYRLDHVVGAVDILVADDLHRHVVRLVFLDIDSSYILIDIFGKDGLQDDHPLTAFAHLYYADVIHIAVAIEVEVAIELLRVVEFGLELLEVLSLSEKVSYYFEIQRLRYIGVGGRDRYSLFGAYGHARCEQEYA
jgi:hypothetical protein